MFGLLVGEDISIALADVSLLALWLVLPALMLCYVRQWLLARLIRPAFALRKSEEDELDRAVRLFARVQGRLESLSERMKSRNSFWRALRAPSSDGGSPEGDELDDLQVYSEHLQAVIVRLRRRPLHRLRGWIHCRSVQSACGAAAALHVLVLALFIALFQASYQSPWTHEIGPNMAALVRYPGNEQFFDANALAAGITGMMAPLFYLVRRAALRRAYSLEFIFFKELANGGPASPSRTRCGNGAEDATEAIDAREDRQGGDWIGILGLSEAATVHEVKQAYKILIRQNHPDRVQDMSLAFKSLAEAETKKINAAYRQALLSVQAC
jgi:hypothetical protein